MIKIPRMVWVIGIVIVIAVVILASLPAFGEDWDDGAPEMTIHFDIRKVSDGTSTEVTSQSIEETSLLEATMSPLTAFTTDVDPLEPDATYTIKLTPSVVVKATSTAEQGDFDVTIGATGEKIGTGYSYYFDTNPQSIATGVAQHNTNTPIPLPPFNGIMHPDGESPVSITGMDIDGATFTISVTSTSALGNTASTTATVELNVLPGGISVEVTGVSTTVS